MKKFSRMIVSMLLVAFSVSPVAFGSTVTPDQLYKDMYISLKSGEKPEVVVNKFIKTAVENKIDVKTVFEAAVAKGFMSQDQLESLLSLAQDNSTMSNDPALVAKAKAANFSRADVNHISKVLNEQVNGATYRCGRYGCYYSVAVVPAGILLLLLLCSPVFFIY